MEPLRNRFERRPSKLSVTKKRRGVTGRADGVVERVKAPAENPPDVVKRRPFTPSGRVSRGSTPSRGLSRTEEVSQSSWGWRGRKRNRIMEGIKKTPSQRRTE